MRARRVLASVVSAVAVVGALSLAAAPAASAADIGLVADCSGSSGPIILPLEASPGDVITITSTNCSAAQIDGPGIDPADYFSSYADGPGAPPYVYVVRADAPLGEVASTFNFGAQDGGDATAMLWHLTIVAASAGTTTDAASIPEWVQAYGRASADVNCIAGWDPSWALWPNGGKGGFVCQRSIPSLG